MLELKLLQGGHIRKQVILYDNKYNVIKETSMDVGSLGTERKSFDLRISSRQKVILKINGFNLGTGGLGKYLIRLNGAFELEGKQAKTTQNNTTNQIAIPLSKIETVNAKRIALGNRQLLLRVWSTTQPHKRR